ncbi:HP1 family phage holin, partial [Citrobacter freundii]|uniref:HP1 family phage holin n=1 Tax=Citrobacter freundii TaxID=546 RepID=UPI001F152295
MYRMDKIREWFSYWFGGLTAMGGVLSLNDWALIVGILCTVGTFGMKWHTEFGHLNRGDMLTSEQH